MKTPMTRILPRRRWWYPVVALLCLVVGEAALAHPHGWIDLRMRLAVDDRGRLTGLEQAWRLDPFYSLVLLEELGQAEEGLEAGLDRLGLEIRDNLAPQGYFTEMALEGDAVAFGEVEEYTVRERDGRIEFRFRLPLAEPLPLAGSRLRYRVFDPTYYLEVVHEAEDDAPAADALVVSGELDCETRILAPSPDPERVAEAARLDATDEAEPGLGRHFAETGEVTCR